MPNEIQEALLKFFSPRDEVIEHWYVPVDNFEFVTEDFYRRIEKELTDRKVPGLEISRVNFSEGGLLSSKREYLRLKRERLVFDICAAPFGTSYFFSFRFIEQALGIKILHLIALFIVVGIIFGLVAKTVGTIFGFGFIAILVVLGCVFFAMRNSGALGLKNLDSHLINLPVIGALYELFLRKDTYHRQDTRLMYLSTVNGITERLVQEITAEKGIKLLTQFRRKPPGADLYQATTKQSADNERTLKPSA